MMVYRHSGFDMIEVPKEGLQVLIYRGPLYVRVQDLHKLAVELRELADTYISELELRGKLDVLAQQLEDL